MRSHLNFDGMSWPNPDAIQEVAWRLQYGIPSNPDRTFAVSVMYAYSWLVTQETQKSRNFKVSRIRAAMDVEREKVKEDE